MSVAAAPAERSPERSIRRLNLVGFATLVLLVLALGVLASIVSLAGAVVASGQVVVESSAKIVQHVTGGIVAEIHVREGDAVEAGEILIRLDATQIGARAEILTNRIDEFAARQARLVAERDRLDAVIFPASLQGRPGSPNIDAIIEAELRQFEARRTSRESEKNELRERIAQLNEEIAGLERQIEAKAREVAVIGNELVVLNNLREQQLATRSQITALERDSARLQGELGLLEASIAQTRGRISEIEVQILQIDQRVHTEVSRELTDVQAQLLELSEQRLAVIDQLQRLDIRAPAGGVVHELSVHTVGGVVGGGESLMRIVPVADQLTVEARVSPAEIDRLHVGQPARIRFPAFNVTSTPEIAGSIRTVSADTSTDPRTGLEYFIVRIGLEPDQLALLGDVEVVPGMVAEAFIETEARTVISFLLKPLQDQIAHTFRER